jgi:predicted alpha/beta-hydrolase family hydrolase
LVGTATVHVPSATPPPATETATPAPTATQVDAGRPVTISVSADVSLAGTLYGEGEVAVIFSNMGDQHQASWAPVAREMAAAGYSALTYDFRYWVNGRMDAEQIGFIADDLLAAVRFVRGEGVETVVLIGASLGGMATAKAAADAGAAAVVIMAAPMTAPGVEVAVTVEELQAFTGPRLFITSEFDDTVAATELEAMYAQAGEPKELFVYPGATAHGTHLLQTEHAEDLRARLMAFVAENVGP